MWTLLAIGFGILFFAVIYTWLNPESKRSRACNTDDYTSDSISTDAVIFDTGDPASNHVAPQHHSSHHNVHSDFGSSHHAGHDFGSHGGFDSGHGGFDGGHGGFDGGGHH